MRATASGSSPSRCESRRSYERSSRATTRLSARLFSTVDRQIALAFIRAYPTPEKTARVGTGTIERFLVRNSYRRRVPASELVVRRRGTLLSGARGTDADKSRSALVFVDLLELLNEKRDELDRAAAA